MTTRQGIRVSSSTSGSPSPGKRDPVEAFTCPECRQLKRHEARGLCSTCYARERRARKGVRVRCSRPGCTAFSALTSLRLCKGHITDELTALGMAEYEACIAEMFANRLTVSGECWEFKGSRQGGYGFILMKPCGKTQRIFVHRLVVQLRAGRQLTGNALHHCDNPPCFRPSHLYEGSQADNVADAVARGRIARGVRNGRAKLTPEQIREIFARHRPGINRWRPGNTAQLALEFGVGNNTIRALIHDGHWSLREAS